MSSLRPTLRTTFCLAVALLACGALLVSAAPAEQAQQTNPSSAVEAVTQQVDDFSWLSGEKASGCSAEVPISLARSINFKPVSPDSFICSCDTDADCGAEDLCGDRGGTCIVTTPCLEDPRGSCICGQGGGVGIKPASPAPR